MHHTLLIAESLLCHSRLLVTAIRIFKVLITLYTLTESSAPIALTATSIGANNIMIQWMPPAMPNGMLSFYTIEVYYSGQLRVENTSDPLTTSFDITRLDPFTNYTIRVAGVNDFGVGIFSESITVQTMESSKCLRTAIQTTPLS